LDGGYTVFGEVVKGLEVIEAIANVKRDENNRPLKDLKMSIKIYQ
jgi:cyclophilin family peptidyl-prolyl cis-trans isomerase